jgi:hypothetical protein
MRIENYALAVSLVVSLSLASCVEADAVDQNALESGSFHLEQDGTKERSGGQVNQCECHGGFGRESLWFFNPTAGGWRILVTNLTDQQCLQALQAPPCFIPSCGS